MSSIRYVRKEAILYPSQNTGKIYLARSNNSSDECFVPSMKMFLFSISYLNFVIDISWNLIKVNINLVFIFNSFFFHLLYFSY